MSFSPMEVDQASPKNVSPRRSIECVSTNSPKRKLNDSQCTICLNPYDDPSLIKSCGHVFCFDCIRKWITQKPNCPLCKQRIDFVKHNFRCTYLVEPSWSDRGVIVTARGMIEEEEFKRLSEHTWPLDTEIELIERALHKVQTMIDHSKITMMQNLINLKFELQKLHRKAQKAERINIIRCPVFRFVIYFMDADRFPLITTHTDITLNRQYVEENADRLRDDLVPFVAREIHAITGLQAINIQTVMDLLMDTFKEPEKYKDKLFAHLKAIGVDHPRTFYRFVYDFASADQSLDLYDSNSRYKTKFGLGPAFTDDDEIQVIAQPDEDDIQFVGTSRVNRNDSSVITLN